MGTRRAKSQLASSEDVPRWVLDYFSQTLSSHEKLFQIIHLSEQGMGTIRAMPKVVEVLAKADGTLGQSSHAERLEAAKKAAALAEAESLQDFPVLHGFAVVSLWSWAEHFVKGLATLWLLHRRDAFATPAIQRLKIKVGDYAQMQKREQAAYLVELLEQDLASALKRGATRFESLLEPFGLSGLVPESCSKTLFELQQVRNVIAHRNGRTDRKLRTDCPWLKLKIDQPVLVTRPMLQAYGRAAGEYFFAVYCRVCALYGVQIDGAP